MTYTVKITKNGNTRSFGFNTSDKASRFAAKMKLEGFYVTTEAQRTIDVLRKFFPEKFAGEAQ